MVEARVYQCPVCGAFARDAERTCRHCSTLLATLRCAQCFELNFPDDLHCRGCGLELGLEPIAEGSKLACPDCKLPLHAFKAGAGELYACERCGGQMVTHGLLRSLVEQKDVLGSALPTGSEAVRGNPLSDRVRYRPCPACEQFMHRKNFGGTSGIVVDVCTLHGTFFDPGELPRVLEFVRRGGLAKARAVLQNASLSPLPSGGLLETTEPPLPQRMLGDVVDLLGFVVDVLRDK